MNKSHLTNFVNHPFYLKASIVLLGVYLFFYILDLLEAIFIPIAFALMFAILLNPLVNQLKNWRVPKLLAILLSLLLALLIVVGLIIFIYSQVSQFAELEDQFKERGIEIKDGIQNWLASQLGFDHDSQIEALTDLLDNSKAYLGSFLDQMFTTLSNILLIFIYTLMFLIYKPLFLNFFYEVFDTKAENQVAKILDESKAAIQGYIVGLMIEMLIIAILNSIAYLIIGVEYAILLGILCAILNLIPYIGGIIGVALPVFMYLLTGGDDLSTPIIIVVAYTLIQLFDNYFVVPKIVSSKVSINAFVAIIVVFLGGALWSISGMFLSILFVAIIKIIFKNVDELKPWAKVLGNNLDKVEN